MGHGKQEANHVGCEIFNVGDPNAGMGWVELFLKRGHANIER
jgi:hypothetical protein